MAWGTLSRQARGYGSEWTKLRKKVIERDKGLCQMCLAEGRVHPGRDVDHKVSKAKAKQLGWSQAAVDSMQNLWLLCVPHHQAKTEEEQGKKKHAPRPTIGPDGWPI